MNKTTRPAVTLKSAVQSLIEEARDKNQFSLSEISTWNQDANLDITLTVAEVAMLAKAPKILKALEDVVAEKGISSDAKHVLAKVTAGIGSRREPFTEPVEDYPELLQALAEGYAIQAKHIRDNKWGYVEDWETGADFENFIYRKVS